MDLTGSTDSLANLTGSTTGLTGTKKSGFNLCTGLVLLSVHSPIDWISRFDPVFKTLIRSLR